MGGLKCIEGCFDQIKIAIAIGAGLPVNTQKWQYPNFDIFSIHIKKLQKVQKKYTLIFSFLDTLL